MHANRTRRMLIGVGNVFRRDDGVGVEVARQVQEEGLQGVTVLECPGEGGMLMEAWKDCDEVVLVDAVRSGSQPGEIHRLNAIEQPIPSDFFHYSTHAFSVAEAVETARALHTLPARLVIYGVEGKDFGTGVELSPEVADAAVRVARRVVEEFRTGTGKRRCGS